MLNPQVIYEDDLILVLDKPPGWVVNDAKTARRNPILQNWLKDNFSYELSGSLEERSGIVHRLDKDTSGLLIVAKKKSAFNDLQMQFKNRSVKKEYIALVHGKMKNSVGVINAPVGRLPWNRERFGVLPLGKEAETGYELSSLYVDDKKDYFSLVRLMPRTGRTHQIRIHLKHIGHPIVADGFYAGRKTSRRDKMWCPRLFLHAGKIKIHHPKDNIEMDFGSPIPHDLKDSLSKLKKCEICEI